MIEFFVVQYSPARKIAREQLGHKQDVVVFEFGRGVGEVAERQGENRKPLSPEKSNHETVREVWLPMVPCRDQLRIRAGEERQGIRPAPAAGAKSCREKVRIEIGRRVARKVYATFGILAFFHVLVTRRCRGILPLKF